ncbi:MAG TPA: hypothetical protein VFE05_12520 [Longimicrobiaceae bacterium]|jgi:hypothetical protein|nr:hypothetical protein [Longimicrobiaceae bacterium]
MRFVRYAMLVPAAAIMAACSDASPVSPRDTQSLYDMSSVTISNGTGAAPQHARTIRSAPPKARFICYVDGECIRPARPMATYDYGDDVGGSTSGSTKSVEMNSWSDNYQGISNMALTSHFKSVGGQGSQGCNATPQQFESASTSGFGTTWGDHYSIWITRYATYPTSETWVWQLDGDHTFYSAVGYSVDGNTQASDTFYSSGRLCY